MLAVRWSEVRWLVMLVLERAVEVEGVRDVAGGPVGDAARGDNHWAGTHRDTCHQMNPDDTFDYTAKHTSIKNRFDSTYRIWKIL